MKELNAQGTRRISTVQSVVPEQPPETGLFLLKFFSATLARLYGSYMLTSLSRRC